MMLTGNPSGWRIINPIRQKYRGVTFRSTLEADWAATLDSFGIAWQYEPQGIELQASGCYRPDFYLPAIGTWLEVKGPGVPGAEKAFELAEAVRCSCLGIDFDHDIRPPDALETHLKSDLCECGWAGGEMVILGLPSAPGLDRKTNGHGYATWVNPRGPQLGLAECRRCNGSWWTHAHSAPTRTRCRACGAFAELTRLDLVLSGDAPFCRVKSRLFGRRRGA